MLRKSIAILADTILGMIVVKVFTQEAREKNKFNKRTQFSTVKNADKIIVFDKEKMVEEGTHEQLLVRSIGTSNGEKTSAS